MLQWPTGSFGESSPILDDYLRSVRGSIASGYPCEQWRTVQYKTFSMSCLNGAMVVIVVRVLTIKGMRGKTKSGPCERPQRTLAAHTSRFSLSGYRCTLWSRCSRRSNREQLRTGDKCTCGFTSLLVGRAHSKCEDWTACWTQERRVECWE